MRNRLKYFVSFQTLLLVALFGTILVVIANFAIAEHKSWSNFINTIGSTFLVSGTIGVLSSLITQAIFAEDFRYIHEREKSGFKRSYPNTKDSYFLKEIDRLIPKAHAIKLYGIGFNMLWEEDRFDLLSRTLRHPKTTTQIYIGEVKQQTDGLQLRFNEEKGCKGAQSGENHYHDTLEELHDLAKEINDPKQLLVRTFNHYPTLCILILDDDIFVYHYGFKTLGTNSPVFHFTGRKSSQARYYRKHFKRLAEKYD